MKIGQRDVKTVVSVLICAMTYLLLTLINKKFASTWYTPFFAGLAAAYSVQIDKTTTMRFGKNRIIGSLFGGLLAIIIVILYENIMKKFFPNVDGNWYLFYKYILVSLAIFILVEVIQLMKQSTVTFVAILTFLSISINAREDISVWEFGFNRIISTSYGVVIAWTVNMFTTHFYKNRNEMHVIEVDDFIIKGELDGYSLYKFRNMIDKKMHIIFFSVHTTSMFFDKCENIKYNLPVILMNGACIYDFKENEYIYEEKLDYDDFLNTKKVFTDFGIDPFVYEISNNLLYVYKEQVSNSVESEYEKMIKNYAYSNYIIGKQNVTSPISLMGIVVNNDLDGILAKLSKIENIVYRLCDANLDGYIEIVIYSSKVNEMNCVNFLKNKYEFDKVISLGTNNKSLENVSDHFVETNGDTKKGLRKIGRTFNRK